MKPNIVPPIRKERKKKTYKKASTIVISLGDLNPCYGSGMWS
jgi:hypothetical protein